MLKKSLLSILFIFLWVNFVFALTIHLQGPGLVNNYPPNNLISISVTTEKTDGSVILWGLSKGDSKTVLGTINIPDYLQVGFSSKPVPNAFPPGEYTLYAQEDSTIVTGAKFNFGKSVGKEIIKKEKTGIEKWKRFIDIEKHRRKLIIDKFDKR